MNEDKIYEYNGKYYSNTDHSLEVEYDEWGGDLYDLYFDASHGELNGVLCESTSYYSAYNPETVYEDSDELVEDYFEDNVVDLESIRKGEKRMSCPYEKICTAECKKRSEEAQDVRRRDKHEDSD